MITEPIIDHSHENVYFIRYEKTSENCQYNFKVYSALFKEP